MSGAATVLKHDALPVYAAPISWMVPRRGQYKQPDSVLVRGPEVVEEGLVYRVDYSAVAGGYFSDQKFNFCLGTPLKESYAVWQEHRDRQIFMENFIRPGMSKREVFAACRAEFKNVEEYMWWIHGVGMEVHEETATRQLVCRIAWRLNRKLRLRRITYPPWNPPGSWRTFTC